MYYFIIIFFPYLDLAIHIPLDYISNGTTPAFGATVNVTGTPGEYIICEDASASNLLYKWKRKHIKHSRNIK